MTENLTEKLNYFIKHGLKEQEATVLFDKTVEIFADEWNTTPTEVRKIIFKAVEEEKLKIGYDEKLDEETICAVEKCEYHLCDENYNTNELKIEYIEKDDIWIFVDYGERGKESIKPEGIGYPVPVSYCPFCGDYLETKHFLDWLEKKEDE